MMNCNKAIYHIVFFALLLLTACTDNDATEQGNTQPNADGKVAVRLHLRVAGRDGASLNKTRWQDANATNDEMMNIWTVYCVDNNPESDRYGKLVFIHVCMPVNDNREIDDLVYLPKGKYAFYSFANIHPVEANRLMTITNDLKKLRPVNNNGGLGDEFDFDFDYSDPNKPSDFFEIRENNPHKGVVYDMKWVNEPANDIYKYKYHEMSGDNDYGMYSSMVYGVDGFMGNGLDLTTTNCFMSKGIPMSNYQEIEITENSDVDLIVIRMVAKIELQLTNGSNNSIKVQTATLSDITQDGSAQICIFPNLNNVGSATQHKMAYTHKDIRPHISDEASVGGYTHPINKTIAAGATEIVTFYVNESKAPKNASGLFYLTLGIGEEPATVEYQHALINQKGSTSDDDNAWDYIARNDYRIIPVTLTDWQFRIEPIAFAPIAGYPATLLSSDALTATFSTGGMIALQPFVKKRTETDWRDFGDTEVTYGVEVKNGGVVDEEASWAASITWKNGDGNTQSGTGKTVLTPFIYDPVTKCVIGELNSDKVTSGGTNKTAVTITLKLGPESGDQYTYSFTCDVNI